MKKEPVIGRPVEALVTGSGRDGVSNTLIEGGIIGRCVFHTRLHL